MSCESVTVRLYGRRLDVWAEQLDPADPRHRHHQLEALWSYRWAGLATMADSVELPERPAVTAGAPAEARRIPLSLLRQLLECDIPERVLLQLSSSAGGIHGCRMRPSC